MAERKRVCIIGAGPCGLSTLYQFVALNKEKKVDLDIVCFEKGSTIGGLWDYSWKTGVDQTGEPVHNGMYRHLWSNGPKECLEFPDYTFSDHFEKPIMSFPPRQLIVDYLKGRFNKEEILKHVQLNTVVRDVKFNKEKLEFSVRVKNLVTNEMMPEQKFDYLIVATGHFSFPNIITFDGFETFPGRIMHSHDFRDAEEFRGKKLLAIGSSYSAEDVAMQTFKYGAEHVITCWRTKPMAFKWPEGIEERPLLQKVEGKIATFADGSQAELDAIILCTGYRYTFPFMPDDLTLVTPLSLYPDNLYKGTIFTKGGNNRLFYMGMQDQYYSFTMFDVQAEWACRVIRGEIQLPSDEEMSRDIQKWRQEESLLKDSFDDIRFQTDFVEDLRREVNRKQSLDVRELFYQWKKDRKADIATYRNKCFKSIFTGKSGRELDAPWIEIKDETQCF